MQLLSWASNLNPSNSAENSKVGTRISTQLCLVYSCFILITYMVIIFILTCSLAMLYRSPCSLQLRYLWDCSGRLFLVLTCCKMKSLSWAFPPHTNMKETFSSNSQPSGQLPWNTKTSVIEMADGSTRVYENNETNWRSMSREGGCCAAKNLHIDYGFTELANWEYRRHAYLINQLWLSHLPEQIAACGFSVLEVLWLLTEYSCYLGELVLLCCPNHHMHACVMPCLCPDCRRYG